MSTQTQDVLALNATLITVTSVPEKLPFVSVICIIALCIVWAYTKNTIKNKSDAIVGYGRAYEVMYGNTVLGIACFIFGFAEHPSAIGRFVHRECILFYASALWMAANILVWNVIRGSRKFNKE